MSQARDVERLDLDVSHPIWDRFFTAAPLVVIGTRDADGSIDLAPKHMVTPMGWDNFFGFVCTESHGTYRNIVQRGEFTVSFPNPDQVLLASLSAAPRCEDDSKPSLSALATVPAKRVNGVFLRDSYLFLECELFRIVDGFGINSLITGRIIAAQVDSRALRSEDRDDQDVLLSANLLVYVSPGRYAAVAQSNSFPFPSGFRRGDE